MFIYIKISLVFITTMNNHLLNILKESNINGLEILRDLDRKLLLVNDSFPIACISTNIELVQWFISNYPSECPVDKIDNCGSFEIFQLLMDKYQHQLNDTIIINGFNMACSNGDISMIDLILKFKPLLRNCLVPELNCDSNLASIMNHPFSLSTRAGHVKVNQYLLTNFSFIDEYIYEIPKFLQFKYVCEHGNFEMFEWIINNYKIYISRKDYCIECFTVAFRNLHFIIANKLMEICGKSLIFECYESCLTFALENNQSEMIYYLVDQFSHQPRFTEITKSVQQSITKTTTV